MVRHGHCILGQIQAQTWLRCSGRRRMQEPSASQSRPGSVVTRSVPAYSVAAGNPCRVLHPRFSVEELNVHLARMADDASIS